MAREAQTSTGLGDGIAMPHSKNAAVKEATVLFAKSNKGGITNHLMVNLPTSSYDCSSRGGK